jgi:hypothetical protein
MLAGAIVAEAQPIPNSFKANAVGGFIPAGEASALNRILATTPSDAEVIVSLPISGRFAQHKYLYLFVNHPPAPIPIKSRTVVMVLDEAHTLQMASPDEDAAALRYVKAHFDARIIGSGPYVQAVEWRTHPGQTAILLP